MNATLKCSRDFLLKPVTSTRPRANGSPVTDGTEPSSPPAATRALAAVTAAEEEETECVDTDPEPNGGALPAPALIAPAAAAAAPAVAVAAALKKAGIRESPTIGVRSGTGEVTAAIVY